MTNDSRRPDVAVFIDFENVYVSVRDKLDANPNFEMIMDRCEDLGRVVIARAYADWYRYPRVTSALYANGIEPMYVPTYYYDREMGRTGRAIKNSVDMNLCIDAMKTLFTNTNIAKFVLATGDRDFIPLVNSIRQQGKEVIVIGIGGAASAHLAQSADEFIFYESLVGKKPSELQQDTPKAKMPAKGREHEHESEEAPPERGRDRDRAHERDRDREPEEAPRAEPAPQPDIYDTLVNAINLARERGYVCSFGSLKLLMKELMGGDFKEGKYKDASGRPFAKFKDFVLEAERRGKVQVFTRGTVNEVFLPGEDPYKLSQFAQEIKEEPGTPVIEVPEQELRLEPRSPIASNGRRRRRRRGGQRAAAQNGVTQPEDLLEDELEESEEAATSDLSELPELPELVLPDLANPALTADEAEVVYDAVFEDLLDRIEEEQAEAEALVEHAAEEASAIAEQAPEPQPSAAEVEQAIEPQPASAPFGEEEWQMLRDSVALFNKPASFQQIHDALRNARNSVGSGRTNEELRSLIKQGINNGMLARLGKGNRVTYRLAEPAAETDAAAPAEDLPEGQEGAPDQSELIAPAAEDATGQPEFYTPEAAAQAEQLATADEAAAAVEVEAPAPARRSRSRRKPAPAETAATPEVEAQPAATAEQPKPRRSPRRKAAPAAEAAPATEEPAKPKRSRRKKTETAE
jgi:uncharacterized protein (TIGR00288 family)